MRLLLVAPLSDRDAVGESWISYQWVSRLAARHDVTVLSYYQRTGRPLAPQVPGARIIEWREPPLIGGSERFNAMLKPGYLPFTWQARRWIRQALASGERFDVAHQLNPVSLRYASPLAGLGIPYVIGPVGGSLTSPPAFAAEEGGAPWFTGLRALDGFRLRHEPSLRRTFADAACVLGIAHYVKELLGDIPVQDFRVLSDIGVETLPSAAPGSDRTSGIKLLFVGRVIRTKGVRDAIRALALLPAGLATLDVVGEGYDRATCEALVAELGLGEAVTFHGRVPHDQVAGFYDAADVFFFPSYREAGGIVVVEAMSHGLPSIVCDRGGPASSVDESSGIRVPARDPQQYAAALAEAVARLAADPTLRRQLGQGARARMAAIGLWDKRVEFVEERYREVMAAKGR